MSESALIFAIIPRPQETQVGSGFCCVSNLTSGHVQGLTPATVKLLRQDLPAVAFVAGEGETPLAVLSAGGATSDADRVLNLVPSHAESYVIEIAPSAITLAAHEPAGLWNAFQTLILLIQEHDVPCGVIRDWPALRRRGIHIDLKGYQPKFERLLEMVRLLGRYKVNTILLEVEDKFAYQSAPDVGIDGAYTAQQMAELGRLCSASFIQLIPKLQSLGHVDYLLKHPRYAEMRENGHPFQYCPRHPKVFPLWRAMAEELMACFPGHDYFHIGADETSHLGECPQCRKHSKASAYIEQVGKCIDFVIEQKRQPIMWDDILRNLHGHLAGDDLRSTWVLGEKAILMYWGYGYNGKDNTFPTLPEYVAKGMRVWGASGYTGCGPGWFQNVPPLRERALNIAAWTKSAIEHRLEGVMTTSWTRIISFYPPTEIPEACWFHMLYAADSMWSGKERDLADHCTVAARSLFGTELPQHAAFMMDLDLRKLPARLDGRPVRRNTDRFALLCAAMEGFRHEDLRQHGWLNIYEILHAHDGLLGVRAPDYALKMFRERLDGFRESLTRRSQALQQTLDMFYMESTVWQFLKSRFDRDHRLIAEFEALLKSTELL